jgi:hypothetical protein
MPDHFVTMEFLARQDFISVLFQHVTNANQSDFVTVCWGGIAGAPTASTRFQLDDRPYPPNWQTSTKLLINWH